MERIQVREIQNFSIEEFLLNNDFYVEPVDNEILQVTRAGEETVFVSQNGGSLYFQSDLGDISGIVNETLMKELLKLNTEILPVSIGVEEIEDELRLTIIESREIINLDKEELLSVFDAFGIAADKVEALLSNFVK